MTVFQGELGFLWYLEYGSTRSPIGAIQTRSRPLEVDVGPDFFILNRHLHSRGFPRQVDDRQHKVNHQPRQEVQAL